MVQHTTYNGRPIESCIGPYDLSNSAIFNDLERPLSPVSSRGVICGGGGQRGQLPPPPRNKTNSRNDRMSHTFPGEDWSKMWILSFITIMHFNLNWYVMVRSTWRGRQTERRDRYNCSTGKTFTDNLCQFQAGHILCVIVNRAKKFGYTLPTRNPENWRVLLLTTVFILP